jgi:hypothetical protein
MNTSTIPSPRLSLEQILKQNQEDAHRLNLEAQAKLLENEAIRMEMHKILKSEPPPVSRFVEAYETGKPGSNPPPAPDSGTKLEPEKDVLYAALAIVRSWKRRHKKNWRAQERELADAVERLVWDK